MAKPASTFGTYVASAFRRKVHLPGLGAMPLNLMALGLAAVLGIANPGFLLLGAAAEVAYLTWMAGNPRFQQLVDAESQDDDRRDWYERLERAVASLGKKSQQRYTHLLVQCRRILGINTDFDETNQGTLHTMRGRSLNQMLWIFVRLLRSREVITDNVENINRQQLEADIARLEEKLAQAGSQKSSALARSLSGTLDINRKRLENLDRAQESLQVINAELQRIEKQVVLLREEAAVSGSPELLSSRLDAVTSTMDETSRWMDANSDLFSALAPIEESSGMELPPAPGLAVEK